MITDAELINGRVATKGRSRGRAGVARHDDACFHVAVALVCVAACLGLAPRFSPAQTPTQAVEPPPPEKPFETLKLGGVVVDEATGKPVPNAEVTVRRVVSRFEDNRELEQTLVAETRHTTDAEGRYSFEITAEQIARRRPGSAFSARFEARHPDYLSLGTGVEWLRAIRQRKPDAPLYFERIALRRGEEASGVLVDPSGRPVAGVPVRGYSTLLDDVERSANPGLLPDVATTDANGRFRLKVAAGAGLYIAASPRDFAALERYFVDRRGDLGVLRLSPGGRVVGRVLDSRGRAIPGAPAFLSNRHSLRPDDSFRRPLSRFAIADADGKFAFDPLPPGEYSVSTSDGYIDPTTGLVKGAPLTGIYVGLEVRLEADQPTASVEISPVETADFTIRFSDVGERKPPFPEVHIFGKLDGVDWTGRVKPGDDPTPVVTIPRGLTNVSAALSQVGGGRRVMYRHRRRPEDPWIPQYHPQHCFWLDSVDDGSELHVLRGECATLRLLVVDEQNRPINDALVKSQYGPLEPTDCFYPIERAPSLGEGRYEAPYVVWDEEIKLNVRAEAYFPVVTSVRIPPGETRDLTIVLKRPSHRPATTAPR